MILYEQIKKNENNFPLNFKPLAGISVDLFYFVIVWARFFFPKKPNSFWFSLRHQIQNHFCSLSLSKADYTIFNAVHTFTHTIHSFKTFEQNTMSASTIRYRFLFLLVYQFSYVCFAACIRKIIILKKKKNLKWNQSARIVFCYLLLFSLFFFVLALADEIYTLWN